MKGVILMCVKELVIKNFGENKWEEILHQSEVPRQIFVPMGDVTDEDTMKVITTACNVLSLSLNQVIDAFGHHWSTVFAPKMYRLYFTGAKSSKEFLSKMDSVHVTMTQRMNGAKPPRFKYEWQNDKTVIMTYSSQRGLIDIAIACIHGVGEYYKEKLQVTKMGGDKIKIVFP
ncbi:heme NO-binding domain-containing protein [Heliobacterium chlorum]|uniref:Heme NO-binding domain-containing protein n=1 Tax=Heliobacterium chlorum TaxID=2698 RepID=A0ABR7T0S0_HELCL|nr:heme NO-binding domain-containing protein [Heliobacterium chlorum]MBC9783578.1 heme NO-binding domain-containing protein [Heliobacterium chlorum]